MSQNDDRVAVQTYVPAYQRDRWRNEADALNMSQAEFVRSMVQAGRHDVGTDSDRRESQKIRANPRGRGLQLRLLDHLDPEDPISRDELFSKLTEALSDRLNTRLDELGEAGVVTHRAGRGFVRTDGE